MEDCFQSTAPLVSARDKILSLSSMNAVESSFTEGLALNPRGPCYNPQFQHESFEELIAGIHQVVFIEDLELLKFN